MPMNIECWKNNWERLRNCEPIVLPSKETNNSIFFKIVPTIKETRAVHLKILNSGNESLRMTSSNNYVGELPTLNFSSSDSDYYDDVNSNERVFFSNLAEERMFLVDKINSNTIYKLTIEPHHEPGNMSTYFFRINDTISSFGLSDTANVKVYRDDFSNHVEEIAIVTIILILWMFAIALFVHRWGKIRVLEPYQPAYKLADPESPIDPGSPNHSIASGYLYRRSLPRKSSSLCFTPSMLTNMNLTPAAYRSSLQRIDYTGSPKTSTRYSRLALRRMRSRYVSCEQSNFRYSTEEEYRRMARSAENLKHARLSPKPVRRTEERPRFFPTSHNVRIKSSSLENCKGARLHSRISSAFASRGMSLESASPRAKTGLTGVPWHHSEGRSTPEIRISPTPPDLSTVIQHSYSRTREMANVGYPPYNQSRPPGLQRQMQFDETHYPLPTTPAYATLHEEENEGEESPLNPLKGKNEEKEIPLNLTNERNFSSQETAGSLESQDSRFSSTTFRSHHHCLSTFTSSIQDTEL